MFLIFVFSVLAKRLAGKSISEMTYFVWSGMLNLNSVSPSYCPTNTFEALNGIQSTDLNQGDHPLDLITSTKEVIFSSLFVCLSVC